MWVNGQEVPYSLREVLTDKGKAEYDRRVAAGEDLTSGWSWLAPPIPGEREFWDANPVSFSVWAVQSCDTSEYRSPVTTLSLHTAEADARAALAFLRDDSCDHYVEEMPVHRSAPVDDHAAHGVW